MSVLSVGFVAGPTSPARRDRLEESTSCGANRLFSLVLHRRGGDGVRGDASGVCSGVSSAPGPAFLYRSNVVSIGIGAKRLRGAAACAIASRAGCGKKEARVLGGWAVLVLEHDQPS